MGLLGPSVDTVPYTKGGLRQVRARRSWPFPGVLSPLLRNEYPLSHPEPGPPSYPVFSGLHPGGCNLSWSNLPLLQVEAQDTVSPPRLVESTEPWLWRADCAPPLYIRDLSVQGFWYLRRVLEPIPHCYRDNCIQKMGQSTSSWPHPKEGLSTQRGLCSVFSSHVVPSLPDKYAMRTNEVIYLKRFESSLNAT